MPRKIIYTAQAPKPQPTYGLAVKAAGLVFVSGTGTTIQEQTHQCLKNISSILAEGAFRLSLAGSGDG